MKGIITKAIGGFFFLADENNKIYQTEIRGKIRDKAYPGDLVEFEAGIIEKIYPRRNLLFRPKLANIDQVLIIQAICEPDINFKLLDRFLIMVEFSQLKPILAINKIDLKENEEQLKLKFRFYQKAGYQVFFFSVKDKKGLEPLIQVLNQQITVLTGPSGVGKTSLINKITNKDLPTAPISPKLKRGVHKTRHVELLTLENGGFIADTPGFTSLNIDYISMEELPYLFPEFTPFLASCKFSPCSHIHEPKCGIKEAVTNGLISKQRFQNYQSFYQELSQKKNIYKKE